MKIIHKSTGVDILKCNDIDVLKDIILEQMHEGIQMSERYAFYFLKCYKENKPLPTCSEWLKLINK